jgi:hypothetical protein
LIWLQGLLCGALVTLATPVAVLLGVLLAPAIGVAMLDRSLGKPRARTAFLFGAAWSVEPVRMLWGNGGDLTMATRLATDPAVVGRAWLAAGGGWLLAVMAPWGVGAALGIADEVRRTRLKARRERLREEWGMGGG